jgi:hypothetical protein
MATAYALLEDMAREGFATHGRGFLLYGVYPDGRTSPYVRYMTLEDELGSTFIPSAQDLVELVRTYDPQTCFVIFEGTINLETEQMEQVQIEMWTFLTRPALAA